MSTPLGLWGGHHGEIQADERSEAEARTWPLRSAGRASLHHAQHAQQASSPFASSPAQARTRYRCVAVAANKCVQMCAQANTHTHTLSLSLSLSLANTRGDSHLYLSFFPEACLCAQACLCQIMCQIMSDHTHTHASVESHTHAFHTAHAGVDVSERAYRFKCRVWFVCGPFLSCFRFLHHRCLLDDTQSGLYICGVCLCTIYVTIILIYYI